MKKNYYQLRKAKYEAEIKQLRKDLNTLVFNPDSLDATLVFAKVKMASLQEQQLMFGSRRDNIEVNGRKPY